MGGWPGGWAGGVDSQNCLCINAGRVPKKNNQAERVSDLAGNKYQDRNGNWRNDEVKDITGLALRRWCVHKGIEYK